MTMSGVLLAGFLFLGLPIAQAIIYLQGQPFLDLSDTLNFTASIVAYHWLLANVLIGLKVPIVQNALPYDQRVRLHVWSSLGLIVLLGWHSVYTIILKPKIIDLVSWSLLVLFSILVVLSVLWIPLPGLKTTRAKLIDLIKIGALKSYDGLKSVHKVLFFVLMILTYVHILQAELILSVPEPSGWIYHVLFLIVMAKFVWTRVQNWTLPMLEVRSAVVSGGILRLSLTTNPRLHYRSGQFAFLRFPQPALRGEEHPFSFTTAPGDEEVGFAIRTLGDFTSRLPLLKPGDRVKVNGGFGSFHPPKGAAPLALIGSGIGAAPLISIVRDLARTQPTREVICLLSVSRREELLDLEVLRAAQAQMPRFTLGIYVYEEDQRLYDKAFFAAELPEPRKWTYYLCSSDKVRSAVIQALRQLGVRSGQIHFEAFNLG